jgi:hypothetical protein
MTEEEYRVLGLRHSDCKYIARNKDGDLHLYKAKPIKKYNIIWRSDSDYFYFRFEQYNNLFKMIQWEDEEPVLIADLLNEPIEDDLRLLLKVGKVVENKVGKMGFVLEDRIMYKDCWDNLKDFSKSLKHKLNPSSDIIGIYDAPIIDGRSWYFEAEDKMLLNTIWEAKEIKVSCVESVILNNIGGGFKYIARNKDGGLSICKTEPTKRKAHWDGVDCTDFLQYAHLFDYIEWKDIEPTLISDLIEMKSYAF